MELRPAKIVAQLGGPKKASVALTEAGRRAGILPRRTGKITPHAVSMWVARDVVPWKWRNAIRELLNQAA